MGAIAASIFASLVAIIAGVYFYIQDRKTMR